MPGLIACQLTGGPPAALRVVTAMPTIDCPAKPGWDQSRDRQRRNQAASWWRVDGIVAQLNVARRTLEVEGIELEIDSKSMVLVDCKEARLRDVLERTLLTPL